MRSWTPSRIIGARAAGGAGRNAYRRSPPFFEPARRLYRKHGFAECGPFAKYVDDPNSVFMTLAL